MLAVGSPDGTWLSSWQASAQAAMQANPEYFAKWDTVKTGLLVFFTGAVAYQLWKAR